MENELPGRFIFIAILLGLASILMWKNPLSLGLDLKGGAELVYKLEHNDPNGEISDEMVNSTIDVILKRIDPNGAKGYKITPSDDRIIISLGGVESNEKKIIADRLGKQGTLEFRMALGVQEGQYRYGDYIEARRAKETGEKLPFEGMHWYGQYLVEDQERIHGKNLSGAVSSRHPSNNGQFVVNLSFNPEGRKQLTELSSEASKYKNSQGRGSSMAIIRDDIWINDKENEGKRLLFKQGNCDSAPSVSQPLTAGSCYIEGGFSLSEAKELALILNSGSLPVTLTIESSMEVGPSLGKKSQNDGAMSCIAGLAVVLVFMSFYYRALGIISSIALILNLIFVWAGMASFGFVLTLPGIAGVILTIGMAVDANVLIYERIKEELRMGYSLTRAVNSGYEKAFVTIFDSNLTTFITGIILYTFGTGAIKGFAITLCLGIIASMFSAIYISRTLVEWLLSKRKLENTKHTKLINTDISYIGKLHRGAVGLSLVVVATCCITVSGRGTDNLGIDFTGGSRVQMSFRKAISAEGIEEKAKGFLEDYNATILDDKSDKKFKYIKSFTARPIGAVGQGNAKAFVFETKDMDYNLLVKVLSDDKAFGKELVPVAFPNDIKNNIPRDYAVYRINYKNDFVVDIAKEVDILKKVLNDPFLILTKISDEDYDWAIFTDPEKHSGDEARTLIASTLAGRFKPNNIMWSTTNPKEVELVFYRNFVIKDFISETESLDPLFKGIKARAKAAAKEGEEEITSTNKVIVTMPESFVLNTKNKAMFKKLLIDNGQVDKDVAQGIKIDRMFQTEVSFFVTNTNDLRSLLAKSDYYILSVEERSDNEKRLIIAKGSTINDNSIQSVGDLETALNESMSDDDYKKLDGNEGVGLTNPVVSSINIRGAVAAEMAQKALWALVLSLIAIVVYIWYRFEFSFGVAAIVALIHDVSITLGVLAMCRIEYDLTIVGAMLTIVGYSLNDTIVVFDRIRENLREDEDTDLATVINKSLNQSFSRTLLTSITTLLAVLVLYFFGGDDLKPFGIALVCGLIVGTYSSMFVASPVLLLFGKSVRTNLRPVEVDELEDE